MCSSSEAGSYSRLIDFVYPSTVGLRVIKKKKNCRVSDGVSIGNVTFVMESWTRP